MPARLPDGTINPYITQDQLDSLNKAMNPGKDIPSSAPASDPLLDKQKQIADEFRKNLPTYSKTLGNQYEAGARRNLASNLKSTDQDFNRRGLLYSSARMGQQVNQQAQSASDIASGKQQINQGLLDKADAMDAGVFTTGMGLAGQDTGAYQLQAQSDIMGLKNDILNQQREGQALGGLFGGIGALGGAVIAGRPQSNSMGVPDPLQGYYQFGAPAANSYYSGVA